MKLKISEKIACDFIIVPNLEISQD